MRCGLRVEGWEIPRQTAGGFLLAGATDSTCFRVWGCGFRVWGWECIYIDISIYLYAYTYISVNIHTHNKYIVHTSKNWGLAARGRGRGTLLSESGVWILNSGFGLVVSALRYDTSLHSITPDTPPPLTTIIEVQNTWIHNMNMYVYIYISIFLCWCTFINVCMYIYFFVYKKWGDSREGSRKWRRGGWRVTGGKHFLQVEEGKKLAGRRKGQARQPRAFSMYISKNSIYICTYMKIVYTYIYKNLYIWMLKHINIYIYIERERERDR